MYIYIHIYIDNVKQGSPSSLVNDAQGFFVTGVPANKKNNVMKCLKFQCKLLKIRSF